MGFLSVNCRSPLIDHRQSNSWHGAGVVSIAPSFGVLLKTVNCVIRCLLTLMSINCSRRTIPFFGKWPISLLHFALLAGSLAVQHRGLTMNVELNDESAVDWSADIDAQVIQAIGCDGSRPPASVSHYFGQRKSYIG